MTDDYEGEWGVTQDEAESMLRQMAKDAEHTAQRDAEIEAANQRRLKRRAKWKGLYRASR